MKQAARYILVIFLLAALLVAPESISADDNVPGSTARARVRRAVDRGLEWLSESQNDNGSWSCKIGYKLNSNYIGKEAEHVGVTALGGMAFIASGYMPGRGKYGENVEKALKFVLESVRPEDGYITRNRSRMYSHAFATLFLAEIYGMNQRADVRDKLRQAVNCIIYSQNKEGGWRYQPTPVDADLSVTVSTVQALRAARNVGITVPSSTIEKAMEYVHGCVNLHDGSFNYQKMNRSMTRATYALTACGVTSLYSAGEYRTREVKNGVKYLYDYRRHQLRWGTYHYFYGHYYTVQALYQYGGKYWADYWNEFSGDVIGRQNTNGSWRDDVGQTYATAMACLLLSIPDEYLPIFQK